MVPAVASGGFATVYRIVMDLTEPVLAPLRRVIPPAGMFDLSFTVLFVFLIIVRSVRLLIDRSGDTAW